LKVFGLFSKLLSRLCLRIFFCCESTPDKRLGCYVCVKYKHARGGRAPFCCMLFGSQLCRDSGRFKKAARQRAI
jgi:hypothetical protein